MSNIEDFVLVLMKLQPVKEMLWCVTTFPAALLPPLGWEVIIDLQRKHLRFSWVSPPSRLQTIASSPSPKAPGPPATRCRCNSCILKSTSLRAFSTARNELCCL